MKTLSHSLCYSLLLGLGLLACQGNGKHPLLYELAPAQEPAFRLSADSLEAAGPYFTYDHQQRPVLSWTEQTADKTGWVLKYAQFDPEQNRFGSPITVLPSLGTRPHDENMNKLGFKADGTAVALYAIKHPTEENPYAGSIFYTLSADNGKSWSAPAYLHSDTLPLWGRGYFDLATLPDGELGAVWLDGRQGDAVEGSALYFARTSAGKGFGPDQQIGESTCECCRTDLFADQQGRLHVAYRDIQLPEGLAGKQRRDMSYSRSDDGGRSFTKAQDISPDNWELEGCPHTGPSLAANRAGLHALWFTAGGGTGTYYSRFDQKKGGFTSRELISSNARHPQMVALEKGLVLVWDEYVQQPATAQASTQPQEQGHSHGGGHQHGSAREASSAGGAATIMLQQRINTLIADTTRLQLSDPLKGSASHPVVLALDNQQVLVAWTQADEDGKGVYYRLVQLQ